MVELQEESNGYEYGDARIVTCAYYNVKMRYIVGIDEAGRGPLAGPVAVGAVKIPLNFNKNFFRSIKDSKKLSVSDRELWFTRALDVRKEGKFDFAVTLVSEKVIDRNGIVYAISFGIKKCLATLRVPDDSKICLDGGLKAPKKFKHQRTVIRGDEKIPVISLASIVAKVTRDRRMVRLSKKYPQFSFHIHKGYGTSKHRRAIRKYGTTAIHRQSFLSRLT